MTIDNWLTLTAIASATLLAAATLIAPALAEIIKFRLNQSTAKPRTKSKHRPLKWWAILTLLAVTGFDVFTIYRWTINTSPPTRGDTLQLAMAAAGFLTNMTLLIVALAIDRILDVLSDMVGNLRSLTNVTDGHSQVLKELVKR
jgi:hypothetical protein